MDTGTLVRTNKNLSFGWQVPTYLEVAICKDCKTEYIIHNNNIMCNGHKITKCPWCREDSKPWRDGRGA